MQVGQDNPEDPSPVSFSIVQMAVNADRLAAIERIRQLLNEAADEGAQIVCLQELCDAPYFCQVEKAELFGLAESPDQSGVLRMAAEVAKARAIVVIVPFFERRAAGIYHNSAGVIDADGVLLGIYRKMHIPDDPNFLEKYYFAPGDLGFRTFRTRYATIGVLICWDQWFPEAARLSALGGAEILFYPTAIGWHPSEQQELGATQHESWEIMHRSHAIANGCYVAAPNRTGHELHPDGAGAGDGIRFWGQSVIVAPDGSIVARAPIDGDAILHGTLDRPTLERQRIEWPFLRDRRIDAYSELRLRSRDLP